MRAPKAPCGSLGSGYRARIGATAALTNVGPGLGGVIGPAGSYAQLPDTAKWLLSLGMLAGRLDLYTVFVLFLPTFWRG